RAPPATIHARFEPRIWLADPALEVDDHRRLEDGLGNCRGNDQPAAAVAEVTPPSGHDILRTQTSTLMAPVPYIAGHSSAPRDPGLTPIRCHRPNTLSKSVAPSPAKVGRVRDLGCGC